MAFQMQLKRFLVLLLPVFVTGAGASAWAQAAAAGSCKQVYAELKKTDPYGESLQVLVGLDVELQKFSDLLNRAKEMDSIEIQIAAMTIAPHLEAYFKAAGISFERSFLSLNVGRTKDAESYTLQYPAYKISGSRSGNMLARMMYGAEISLKSRKYPVAFVFDPLYSVKFQGQLGHFNPEVRAIVIGPVVLSYSLTGTTNTLRHEIHHYLESLRVLNGEMSLQRMKLSDQADVSGESYRKFLSSDELETHLRDLRFAFNQRKMQRIDEALNSFMNDEGRTYIEKQRAWARDNAIKNLENILKYTKEALPMLLEQARAGKWKALEKDESTQSIFVSFELKDTEFPTVVIDLKGLVADANKPDQVQQALVSVLKWNQQRVQYIEAEFNQTMQKVERK